MDYWLGALGIAVSVVLFLLGAALLRGRFFRLFMGVCARGRSLSARFARGQRPDSAHPPLFGQPARPDHGPWVEMATRKGLPTVSMMGLLPDRF